MNWIKVGHDKIVGAEADIFKSGALYVIVSKDGPDLRWHISISHKHRYPTWDEIKAARYDLVPNDVTMAMLLPPKEQFINLHQNCFHLHEWRDREVLIPIYGGQSSEARPGQ